MSGRPRKRRARHDLTMTMSVQGMPELMATVYRRVAELIRDVAADEPPAVAERLRAIAAVFETGLLEDLPKE
jgi:hypothetical protein